MKMKQMCLLVGLLLCSACTTAQSTAQMFELKNSSDGQSVLKVFLPTAEKATGKAVVACPGGAYQTLAWQKEGTDWAEFFNERGIALIVLKYRMPNGDRTIPLSDAAHAIKTVRDSAVRWHLNPYDVGIMGFSAGGHLAATMSTSAAWAVHPNFTILFYPVITMLPRHRHETSARLFLGDQQNNKSLTEQFSNELQVRRHLTPPAFLMLTNDDRAVSPVYNGVAYYQAMRRAGNEAAMVIYPTGGHGFGFSKDFAYHQLMLDELSAWLKTLKAPAPNAVRVACIGNSITDGMGIDMAEIYGYPAVLQRRLGTGYHVKNFGVSARTLLNKGDHPYMQEQAWHDALAFNPNIAVIKLGTNDSKDHNWKHGSEFEHDLQQMIDSLKALPAQPKIYLAYPLKPFKPMWTINDSVIVKAMIPIINEVAQKNKATVIDLHSLITDERMMQQDGIHPNQEGAQKIAEAVAAAMRRSAINH